MGVSCVKCSQPLGLKEGEVPFNVAAVDDPAKSEAWCPQCFVWHRASQEPERFATAEGSPRGGYRAIRCTNPNCALVSVDPGVGRCLQCNCGHVMTLPPRVIEEAKPAKAAAKK